MSPAAPRVSVVIPARNAAATIGEALAALACQSIADTWELVVVDNGSDDGTAEVTAKAAVHPACSIRVVSEPRRGLNVARNAGVRAALADHVAICDADDAVDIDWLAALVTGLEFHDVVGGAFRFSTINSTATLALRGWQGVAEPAPSIGREFGFLDQLVCGNVAFRRDVWDHIGGFDESFSRGGDDVDFTWRAQLASFTVGSVPEAVLHYRARPDARSMFRQYARDGEGSAHLYARYRADGMPGRRAAVGVRTFIWLLRTGIGWRRLSPVERGHWIRAAGKQWGRCRGSLRHRVVYL